MPVKFRSSSNDTVSSTRQVPPNEVNLILKSLNTKNVFGRDKIPVKIVNLVSKLLSTPFENEIKNNLASSKCLEI